MAKPADRPVSLAELRFKPANSNDAARAVLAHHFDHVPRCSYARDDGISQYLGSESGIGTFPAAPNSAAADEVRNPSETPAIRSEQPDGSAGLRRRLLRAGFALSVALHVAAAFALSYMALKLPDDTALQEGVTAVTIVLDGDSDINSNLTGDEEDVDAPETPVEEKPEPKLEKPIEQPVAKPVEKPLEQKVVEEPKPQPAEASTILKDLPLPTLGAVLPEILTAKQESKTEIEEVAKPQVIEPKVEPEEKKPVLPVIETKPVITEDEKPVMPVMKTEPVEVEEKKPVMPVIETKPVEKPIEEKPKPEEKKPEPKKEPEKTKPKPVEKQKKNRGKKNAQDRNSRRGTDAEKSETDRQSVSSRGDSNNQEQGNASKSNYRGLVNRKLARAKGRVNPPAKGTVTVSFVITANGSISGLRIKSSSGKPAVDAAALRVVQSAAPFPAPTQINMNRYPANVQIVFKR